LKCFRRNIQLKFNGSYLFHILLTYSIGTIRTPSTILELFLTERRVGSYYGLKPVGRIPPHPQGDAVSCSQNL
jgi:hypothetical protein